MKHSKDDIFQPGSPGGLKIIDAVLSFCNFSANAKIIDVGCGNGRTVRYLRRKHALDAWGLDKNEQIISLAKEMGESPCFLTADAKVLPFEDANVHGIFFQCSLSKMEEPDSILKEAFRVLKPKGFIAVSDFYARTKEALPSGVFGRMEKIEKQTGRMEISGFSIRLTRDYSDELETMWGQMILDHGLDRLRSTLKIDGKSFSRARYGYCLMIGQKPEKT